MDKLTSQQTARLHELHRPRTQLRHEVDMALTRAGSCTYDLSVWSGRENWMEMTSQQSRDEAGAAGLAKLDQALVELKRVRDNVASYLAMCGGEIAQQLENDKQRAAAEDAELQARLNELKGHPSQEGK